MDKILLSPSRDKWEELCLRPSSDNPVVRERVSAIIDRVREGGDRAIVAIEDEIAGRHIEGIGEEVTQEEFDAAAAGIPDSLKTAIKDAAKNIRAFHEAELMKPLEVETAKGVRCMQKMVPIQRVGLDIPGGTAPLFSTVLMLALPAKIAGCPELILCSPAGPDGKIAPAVLYAAHFCGVDKVFKVGGAQAIAAMAYGTERIPRVHKIFGPGNQYVTTAKQMLGGKQVAIDMPAGPSEVMVLADATAKPSFVAADLLSQAEHGRDSQVMLVCSSKETAEAVAAEVDRQVAALSRQELAEGALSKSRFVVFDNVDDIVAFANAYAPEHLIIQMAEPWTVADRITAAGSVFVGEWSPESAGDYASGTNHTLPTCGWARSYNGVNIDSFVRKITFQELTREGLMGLAPTIIEMAEAEGLGAHANAAAIRVK